MRIFPATTVTRKTDSIREDQRRLFWEAATETAVEIKQIMNGNANVSHLQDLVSKCAQN